MNRLSQIRRSLHGDPSLGNVRSHRDRPSSGENLVLVYPLSGGLVFVIIPDALEDTVREI
jgi:hypothetical protein